MSTLLRIALAWLLAVAIPLQGYAASRMLLCGPAHHPAAVAERVVAPSHPAEHSMAHTHVNAHEQSDRVLVAASTIEEGSAEPAAAKPGHAGKCSLCASCCHSAALLSEALAVPAMPHDSTLVSALPLGHERAWVGRLDRPPQRATA